VDLGDHLDDADYETLSKHDVAKVDSDIKVRIRSSTVVRNQAPTYYLIIINTNKPVIPIELVSKYFSNPHLYQALLWGGHHQ